MDIGLRRSPCYPTYKLNQFYSERSKDGLPKSVEYHKKLIRVTEEKAAKYQSSTYQ